MRFIEIAPNITVNTSQIAWIASEDEGLGSTISIGGKEYPSTIPYKTLVQIIQSSTDNKTMEKLSNYLDVATVTTL